MNHKTTLIAALMLSSAFGAWAATADATEASPERTERMGEALSNYRSKVETHQNLGPASRTEAAIHRGASRTGAAISNGARKTGEAIEHGAKKTTEFVGNGLQRAGGAVERAGEKVEGSAQK